MASITLKASARDTAKKGKTIRKEGLIPGTVYGPKTKNVDLCFAYQEFHKVYVAAGESTLVELEMSSGKVPVLIHALQFHPVTGDFIHIDLFAPDMTKEITANVPLRIVGEAPGVKEQGGVIVRNRDHVTVKCLPKDLPHDIEVDISVLVNFHDSIMVSQLKVSAAVKITDDAETFLISLIPPRAEEAEVAPVAAVDGAAVDGAVPAEGASAAGAEGEKKEEGKAPATGKPPSAKATGGKKDAKK